MEGRETGRWGQGNVVKKAAILQSAYVPWRGYFDLIASVDEFIFYDDVQFSHGDWRNRNIIKTANGPKWLTIPVPKRHRISTRICDIDASDPSWSKDHWQRIIESYRKAPAFQTGRALLEPLYERSGTHLSTINIEFTKAICVHLGIETRLSSVSDYDVGSGKTQRLIELCRAAKCTTYVSGPAARAYLDVEAFGQQDIEVEWFSYDRLEPYPQLHGEFVNTVSIIDLLMNCGDEARRFLPSTIRNPEL